MVLLMNGVQWYVLFNMLGGIAKIPGDLNEVCNAMGLNRRQQWKNLELVKKVQELAAEKQCTPSQLALAWVLSRGSDVIPIPGTRRSKYLHENLAAQDVILTAADVSRLNAAAPKGATAGLRYPAPMMERLGK